MKIYCCRLKEDNNLYAKLVRLVGNSYVPVSDTKDITFSGDLEEMERLVSKYTELEVCCMDATPTPLLKESNIQKMQL